MTTKRCKREYGACVPSTSTLIHKCYISDTRLLKFRRFGPRQTTLPPPPPPLWKFILNRDFEIYNTTLHLTQNYIRKAFDHRHLIAFRACFADSAESQSSFRADLKFVVMQLSVSRFVRETWHSIFLTVNLVRCYWIKMSYMWVRLYDDGKTLRWLWCKPIENYIHFNRSQSFKPTYRVRFPRRRVQEKFD